MAKNNSLQGKVREFENLKILFNIRENTGNLKISKNIRENTGNLILPRINFIENVVDRA